MLPREVGAASAVRARTSTTWDSSRGMGSCQKEGTPKSDFLLVSFQNNQSTNAFSSASTAFPSAGFEFAHQTCLRFRAEPVLSCTGQNSLCFPQEHCLNCIWAKSWSARHKNHPWAAQSASAFPPFGHVLNYVHQNSVRSRHVSKGKIVWLPDGLNPGGFRLPQETRTLLLATFKRLQREPGLEVKLKPSQKV